MARLPRFGARSAVLVGTGIEVYVVEEDIADRGLGNAAFVDGIQRVSRAGIPAVMGKHDQIWYW